MVKNNKKCILCGKVYSYCNSCSEFDHLPRWMECYCSENCKEIFNALSAYNMKTRPVESIIATLKASNLEIEKYHEANQRYIKEILEKDTAAPAEPVAESAPQEVPIEEIMNAPVEDTPIVSAETSIPEEIPVVESDTTPAETIADPIMGTVKQPKRMKYTKRSN